jgi:hypothetical protein
MKDMFYPENVGQVVKIGDEQYQVVESEEGCSDCEIKGVACRSHSCMLWNADGSPKIGGKFPSGEDKGIDVVYKKLNEDADNCTEE